MEYETYTGGSVTEMTLYNLVDCEWKMCTNQQ